MTAGDADPVPRIAVPDRLDPRALTGLPAGFAVVDIGGGTMGTQWSVRLALPPHLDLATLQAVVDRKLGEIVAQMSHWDDTSLLSRFNAAPPGHAITLPNDFAVVVEAALNIAEASGGAFDPALGRLTDCWGLGPRPAAGPPTDAARATALAASGWRQLSFDRAAGRLGQPGGVWLDLSGIAKGFAADAVADRLATLGVHHALVEIGGECVGRGMRPDGDPWWVDLETPPDLPIQPLRVALSGLGVATSGNYLRGAHLLSPITGDVASEGAIAVSVIAPSCMIADAWASALAVLSEERARFLANENALAVRAIARSGREWLSEPLEQMLT